MSCWAPAWSWAASAPESGVEKYTKSRALISTLPPHAAWSDIASTMDMDELFTRAGRAHVDPRSYRREVAKPGSVLRAAGERIRRDLREHPLDAAPTLESSAA